MITGKRKYACSTGCREQLVAEAKGLRLGDIGITAINAEFNPGAAAFKPRNQPGERVVVVGLVSMEHEVGAVKPHRCEAVIVKEASCPQHFCCKRDRAGDIAHQQVEADTPEAAPIDTRRNGLNFLRCTVFHAPNTTCSRPSCPFHITVQAGIRFGSDIPLRRIARRKTTAASVTASVRSAAGNPLSRRSER